MSPAAATGSGRRSHLRHAEAQEVWIGFGGRADQLWLRLLRPGFRHCFAALRDGSGWTVLDPLSGRLLVTRLDAPGGFDLPGFWRRAGCTVLGPFRPAAPRARRPWLSPFSCVSLCRALLGPGAPRAVTPFGLFRGLDRQEKISRKIFLTTLQARM
ncbi:hypothetical protein LPC08_18345 [Roseomonas sp. OT10]|uniref:hypothetical protein n=1 Tax=Roseomonas cutis TaxID=2897332 RepID=UPI001E52ABEC|nr:hypothetical protein [Roseomonas sp. OT10]UFN47956.1 hypothetical protein LPC08_18345 [Roseomonas sp. OT10]